MPYLILIFFTIALLAGFLALTHYEARRGFRFYASGRERFDSAVGRAQFIIENVNLAAFIRDELRHLASRMGHDVAHFSLVTVRAAERGLTRLVRHLRSQPEIDVSTRETAREFVKTLSDFKSNLKATHPEISDIQ